jgi:hypothetical protein
LKNAFGKDDWSELLWQKNLRKERNLPRSPNIHSLRYDDLPSDIQGVLQDLIDYVKNEKHPMPESYVEHHTGEPHSHGIMHELKNDIREMHSKLLSMEESMNGLHKQGDESEEPDQKAGFIREFDRLKTGYGITERRYKQAIREYRKLRERGVEDQKRSQWLLENTAKISLIESVTERQKALEAGETTIDDEIAHTEQQLRLSQGHYLQRNYFKQKLEALKKKKKAGETHYKYQRRHYIKIGNTLKNLPKEEKQKEFKKWDEIFRADNERYDSQKFADFIGLFSGEARKVVKKKLQ